MNKQELLILIGLPASGKTTYARQWVEESPKTRVRINRDDIRRMFGPYWIPQREDLVTKVEDQLIVDAIEEGYDVVVDATNLRGTQRFEKLVDFFRLSAEITVQSFLDVDPIICIERDKNRENAVGKDVIWKMYDKYLGKFKELRKKVEDKLTYHLTVRIEDKQLHIYASYEERPIGTDPINKYFNTVFEAETFLRKLLTNGSDRLH